MRVARLGARSRMGGALGAEGSQAEYALAVPPDVRSSKGPRFRFLCEEHLKLLRRRWRRR